MSGALAVETNEYLDQLMAPPSSGEVSSAIEKLEKIESLATRFMEGQTRIKIVQVSEKKALTRTYSLANSEPFNLSEYEPCLTAFARSSNVDAVFVAGVTFRKLLKEACREHAAEYLGTDYDLKELRETLELAA